MGIVSKRGRLIRHRDYGHHHLTKTSSIRVSRASYGFQISRHHPDAMRSPRVPRLRQMTLSGLPFDETCDRCACVSSSRNLYGRNCTIFVTFTRLFNFNLGSIRDPQRGKTCRTIDPLVTKLMSSIEVVKSFYKTLASDGLAALDLLEASTQWTEMFPGYAGTSIGPEAIRRNLFEPLGRNWDSFVVTPDSFVVDGSIVVAFGTYTGTNKATGKSLNAPFAHRWEVIDGRVTKFRQYTDTALIKKTLT